MNDLKRTAKYTYIIINISIPINSYENINNIDMISMNCFIINN